MQHTDPLLKRQQEVIDEIESLITNGDFANKSSDGIEQMRQLIEWQKSENDPTKLLSALVKIAKDKAPSVTTSAKTVLKGDFRKAAKQIARGIKKAGGKVNTDVDKLYRDIANIGLDDPYLYIDRSQKENTATDKNFTQEAPARLSRNSMFANDQRQDAHQIMTQLLSSAVNPRHGGNTKEEIFLNQAGATIREIATSSYGRDGKLIPVRENDDYMIGKLEYLVTEFKAVYRPKFADATPPKEPKGFINAFNKVKDLFAKERKNDFSIEDLGRLQKQCVAVYKTYQAVEAEKNNQNLNTKEVKGP